MLLSVDSDVTVNPSIAAAADDAAESYAPSIVSTVVGDNTTAPVVAPVVAEAESYAPSIVAAV